MTNQAYIKYEMLQNGKVSKIWEMSIPQQTKYDRWSDKIIEMKMKCERRQGKESKKIADLRKIKKKIRKKSRNTSRRIREIITTKQAAVADNAYRRRTTRTKKTRKLVKTVE